jgi:hypothetical protein
MKLTSLLLGGMICLATAIAGCKPADDAATEGGDGVAAHDHEHGDEHEHPKSLLEGFQMLGDLHGVIQAAFEKNDPDAAHGELHEVAHVLDEDMPALIDQNESLSDEQKSQLKDVISALFDEFSKLDDVLHGGPEIDFAAVNSKIAENMDTLKGLIQ